MNEATTAPHIGSRKAANSNHRLAVEGRIIKAPALVTAATKSAQPRKAFAGYQISELDRVTLVLKP